MSPARSAGSSPRTSHPFRRRCSPRIALLETHRLVWDFTPEADKAFDEWYQDLQSRRKHVDDEAEIYGRIQVYVLRILGHLAFWLGELPKTADVCVERHGDGSQHVRILDVETAGAAAGAGVTVPVGWPSSQLRTDKIWNVIVTPEMVQKAIAIAEYEVDTRLRCIPPKGM